MMKRLIFPITLTEEERVKLAARCHFAQEQQRRIDVLYEAVLPLLKVEACFALLPEEKWERFGVAAEEQPATEKKSAAERELAAEKKQSAAERESAAGRREKRSAALCAVTLGGALDTLQELYGGAEAVSDDYILECLGSALLEKAYERLGELLFQETGLFLNGYVFPGTDIPIERIGDILSALRTDGEELSLSCNEAYLLRPRKSVAFVGVLGEKRSGCMVCAGCLKTDCENRRMPQPEKDEKATRYTPQPEKDEKTTGHTPQPGKDAETAEHTPQPGKDAEMGAALRTGKSVRTGTAPRVNYSYGYQKIFGTSGERNLK